ncbi:TadE/TadG family type IV pilus assembly protein, partial [Ilumatobacter sp.]
MVPFIIVGMMMVVQFGLAAYARQVVAGAAQDGADTGARAGSSPGQGVATTDQ